jgi:hypothetical protein
VKPEHDRDRGLDPALRQALGAGADLPASDDCLDAETLAAWMDGGLDPPAVALAEAHVSSCTRCQALVSAMAHTVPETAVPMGERTSLWRWWLAPIAVGAAAVTLWMVVPDDQYTAPPAAPAGEVAPAPSGDVAAEPPPPPPSMSAPSRPPPEAPRPSEEALRRDAGADALAETKRADGMTGARREAPAAEAQMQAVPLAPSAARAREGAPPRDIVSPDPAVRWRLGENGAVDYTVDGGRTWARASTGVTTGIATGSSPSPAVCWLVGPGGLVLVTADGHTFARVEFPEPADLADVQASDARTAVVTAADGRVFVTDDGGLNWRQR